MNFKSACCVLAVLSLASCLGADSQGSSQSSSTSSEQRINPKDAQAYVGTYDVLGSVTVAWTIDGKKQTKTTDAKGGIKIRTGRAGDIVLVDGDCEFSAEVAGARAALRPGESCTTKPDSGRVYILTMRSGTLVRVGDDKVNGGYIVDVESNDSALGHGTIQLDGKFIRR